MYRCPACLENVKFCQGAYQCVSCGSVYQVNHGIPIFINRPADFHHWGIEQRRMQVAIEKISEGNWPETIWDFQKELGKDQGHTLWRRTFSSRRAGGKLLMWIPEKGRILDIGSGWGNLSLNIASYCDSVVAMDQVFTHLRWLQEVSKAVGTKNIQCVQAGDMDHLPFPEAYFDGVLLNGVLEWAAVNRPGDPRSAQLQLLKEVSRVLKPEGQVYIAIENRISYRYLRGSPEGHIRMRYGSLLPRFLTKAYLKWKRGEDFRAYTYSLSGYKKLLREAGLKKQVFYCPWPHYGNIESVEAVDHSSSGSWKVTLPKNKELPFPLSKYLVPSYSIVSSQNNESRCILSETVRDFQNRLADEFGNSRLRGSLYKLTRTGKAFVRIDSSQRSFLIKIGLDTVNDRQLANHAHWLKWIRRAQAPDRLKQLVPEFICEGKIGRHRYHCEQFVSEGVGAEQFVSDVGKRDRLIHDVSNILTEFHNICHKRVTIDQDFLSVGFLKPLEEVDQWLSKSERVQYDSWFQTVKAWLHNTLMDHEILLVPRHGDFVPNNILVDKETLALRAILDWEFTQADDLPLLDLMTFLGRAFRPMVRANYIAQNKPVDQVQFLGYPEIFVSGAARDTLSVYMDHLGLSQSLLEPLIFMWWVKHIQDWLPYYRYQEFWKQSRVLPFLDLRLKGLIPGF